MLPWSARISVNRHSEVFGIFTTRFLRGFVTVAVSNKAGCGVFVVCPGAALHGPPGSHAGR